tara:strand:+ start:7346 stop:8818 length:1473 start_codon:yes stop_codon:yes gene_type:complete
MGSRDRTYRPGNFSTPRMALGAMAQSIRDSLSYDTLAKVESLHVKVLTRPMPLDIELSDAIMQGPQNRAIAEDLTATSAASSGGISAEQEEALAAAADVEAAVGVGTGTSDRARAAAVLSAQEESSEAADAALRAQLAAGNFGGGRFYFKGRVEMIGLDGSKTLSNYHNLLPDPCNMPITANPKQVIRILSSYPTFVSQSGYEGKMPMVGETVKVTMHRGDFAQNGQWNEFDTLSMVDIDTGEMTLPSEGKCAMLSDLFTYGDMDANGVDSTLGQNADAPDITMPSSDSNLASSSRPSPDATLDDFPFQVENALDYPLGRIIRSSPRDFLGIVLHYTAGWSADSCLRTLAGRGLSYHFIIERNGSIVQCTKLKDAAQHCRGYNSNHIGISFVNVGYQRDGVSPESSPATTDPWYLDDGTMPLYEGNRGHTWQPYPPEQVTSAVRLVKHLVGLYPNILSEHVITHNIAEPNRKLDTGPALDLVSFRQKVFG